MTPITLEDGRTLNIEYVSSLKPTYDTHQTKVVGYSVLCLDGSLPVSKAEGDAISAAMFEAQRREIAVKLLAAFVARPDFDLATPDAMNVSFILADQVLAQKGAKG